MGYHDARAVAYGSGTVCDNGMGMVEDLFTLAAHRGRGIASSIIEHCVAYCAERGAKDFLLGSHVTAPPKKLYQKLGFQPVCVTREYFRKYS
ncbi:MAG: GNAT family N-acetyltransferase [Gammaproteobacteria bacterium]|nr:GNAT family N-acetyltransferase [Gammaproteobacteria bacterium]